MAPGPSSYLGEFEQLELEAQAGRSVSRSALYTTLDRLEQKQLVRWKIAVGGEERGRLPHRVYSVTARGLASIRAAQRMFRKMTDGLEQLLEEPGS